MILLEISYVFRVVLPAKFEWKGVTLKIFRTDGSFAKFCDGFSFFFLFFFLNFVFERSSKLYLLKLLHHYMFMVKNFTSLGTQILLLYLFRDTKFSPRNTYCLKLYLSEIVLVEIIASLHVHG